MTLQQIIDSSKRIVFFGGAGVSTESGIPDFRSSNGLYNQKYPYPAETVLSHSFFMTKPRVFYEFYREKMIIPGANPSGAHLALRELEKQGKLLGIITQNIDGLHQAAGSQRVYELHGSIHRNYCMKCGAFYPLDYIQNTTDVPRCQTCGGIVKPDVVLYEEALSEEMLYGAVDILTKADTLIIGGTSLTVYPAAGLIRYFGGDTLVVMNRDATQADSRADLVIRENIGQSLSHAVFGR